MKKSVVFILFALLFGLSQPKSLHAASVTPTWDGTGAAGSNSLDVDDSGGIEDDNDFTFRGDGHTSTTDFIVSDGTNIAVGDSNVGPDFVGNGVTLFQTALGDTIPFANVDQIVLQTLSPFTPVTMALSSDVNLTGTGVPLNLRLEQITYIENSNDFAIIELRAVNITDHPIPAAIGVANDWDVGVDGSGDDGQGFDATRQMVFQQEFNPGPDHISIGMASLVEPVSIFRLGDCCDLTDTLNNVKFANPYILHRHFLNNDMPAEECDDGNNDANDTCTPKCHNPAPGQNCGNGTIEGDEECDGGLNCDANCLSTNVACGNGVLDPGEECDDGNRIAGDDCDFDCRAEFSFNGSNFCGDGFVQTGATGNQVDPSEFPNHDIESTLAIQFPSVLPGQGVTTAFCIAGGDGSDGPTSLTALQTAMDACIDYYVLNIAICGNSVQNAGEQCDDGNTTDNDGCDSNCTITGCGNDILNPGEQCDDGNVVDGDGCSSTCVLETGCGNGTIDKGEGCDDGNTVNGDGCSDVCQLEGGLGGGGCQLSPLGISPGAKPFGAFALVLAAAWGLIKLRQAKQD